MTALFFLFSFTSCSNNSAPTSENLVAGNTYKTTSAKKGNSANTLTEGVDEDNYCTMVFAASENTWTLTGTGNSMVYMTCSGTYTIDGTALTFNITSGAMNGNTASATVSSDGSTLTWPAQNIGSNWISATYVKQ